MSDSPEPFRVNVPQAFSGSGTGPGADGEVGNLGPVDRHVTALGQCDADGQQPVAARAPLIPLAAEKSRVKRVIVLAAGFRILRYAVEELPPAIASERVRK